MIKCNELKMIFVPYYPNLTIEKFLSLLVRYPEVREFLPEDRDIPKLPRGWICNVFFTIVGTPFREWVFDQIAKRNEKVATVTNVMIDVDAEIYKAF